ncbi:hypothetical protein AX15_004347 [Amanita polypyramis BW_CC]|nr:hypothetical protein AX15_004347 [Amanita polypyramis BW_CC]
MGNSSPSTQYSEKKRSLFHRKHGSFLSRLRLGCTNVKLTMEKNNLSVQETATLVACGGPQPCHKPGSQNTMPTSPSLAYKPVHQLPPDDVTKAYRTFLHDFPEYRLTWILDVLRRSDFTRLDQSGETYVDYMGGALYPESLIRAHTDFLGRSIFGNTHSVSNSARLSTECANEARAEVLRFLNAPEGYAVIFTANATAALKLVAEAFPFTSGSSYVLGADSHNSVHGIRQYALGKGAIVGYIPSTPTGGFDLSTAKKILLQNKPQSLNLAPSLFALTAQSNISNHKSPLSIASYASSMGYYTLLDAAALAPASTFSLSDYPVDALAISFYKMFGYPTGVGALVVKKSFLTQLKRPWFAGGTVNLVQVPGVVVTRSHELHEQFEDGTINYLALPAVTEGLRFLSTYLPFLPVRLSCLIHYLTTSLSELRHDTTGSPVIRILSRLPEQRVKTIGEQSETGSTVSLVFLDPKGEIFPNSFIEFSASQQHISLRTGCVCNPGGAAALLNLQDVMTQFYPGVTLCDIEKSLRREIGVVRISLGLASNFQDVWRVIQYAREIGTQKSRQYLWNQWGQLTERDS